MRVLLEHIFRILLLTIAFVSTSLGQTPDEDIDFEQDTSRAPSGLDFMIDYGKLFTVPTEFEMKAEGAFGFTFREKLHILAEIGYGKLSPKDAIKNGEYSSEGVYIRGGITYGGEVIPGSFVYLGAMYGTSRFEDSGTVLIESQAFDSYDGTFRRKDLEATWIEFILISETRMGKNIYLGSKWRLRNLNAFQNNFEPPIYSIPGYGRTFDNSVPAVNLFIKYRIEF